MNKVPSNINYNAFLNDYLREVHCVCPKCGGKGVIYAESKYSMPWFPFNIRFICGNCSHRITIKHKLNFRRFTKYNPAWGFEPYFGYALRNQIKIKGHTLCLLSPEHAQHIAHYVAAKDRPSPQNTKWAMVNRLPKWVKLAKNRRIVLNKLSKLEW